MPRLEGKTAVVTGSNQNIGRAVVELFAKEGANVVVNGARSREKIDQTVEAIREAGGRAIGVLADVSQSAEVDRLVAKTNEAFGPVDIAISNVGVRRRMPFESISDDEWNGVIGTNLSPSFYLARAVIPKMKERRWGRLIFMSGYDGFFAHITERAANITCKAGMHGLAKALAREYGEFGITSNSIAIGTIDTIRAPDQHASEELKRKALERLAVEDFGTCEDVAEACLYLAGKSGRFVTGSALHVNGGAFMI